MERPEKRDVYNRSLERALQIIDAFTEDRQSLTSVQLSEILDLSRATVMRLCTTLLNYGYLKQDRESRCYSLGMRLFEQGSIVFHSLSIRKAASPHLTELLQLLGKTVFLAVLDNDVLIYLDKREDDRSLIRFTSKLGTRRPPYWGMCGPMLMAYLPDSEVERLLDKTPLTACTKKSITDKEEFKAWLRRIREEGTVIDVETSLDGITGVAAPIRDFSGQVVASLGVALLSSSADAKTLRRLLKEVSKSARAISKELGHRETPERK